MSATKKYQCRPLVVFTILTSLSLDAYISKTVLSYVVNRRRLDLF